MTTTTIDHLLAAIDAGDKDTLPILADALEEAGDPRADGVRWLAQEKKWPLGWLLDRLKGVMIHLWYDESEYRGLGVGAVKEYLLPIDVFTFLKADGYTSASYPSIAKAVMDAAEAKHLRAIS